MIQTDPLLVVSELTKVYRGKTATTAVDRLSFSLGRGEVLGLLGPNGAGKTTTIQMLLSALEPTSGRIEYFGKELKAARREILGRVGFASAYSRLPTRLSVSENLDVFGRLYGLSARERRVRSEELLKRFGVWDLRRRTAESLSSGQVTRVMLAKAFLAHPWVALLDEPTASLDPDIAALVRSFVRDQRDQDQASVLFTSHNMDEVSLLCDRVIFLDRGRLAASGTPDQLARSVASSRVRFAQIEGHEELLHQARARGLISHTSDGTIDVEINEEDVSELLSGIAAAGVRYREISMHKPSLEDYFLKVAADGSRTSDDRSPTSPD